MHDVYPLTVIADRYHGTYSGGKFTAWNCDSHNIPYGPESDDVSCSMFWSSERLGSSVRFVGRGNTPREAINDLQMRLERGVPSDMMKYGQIMYEVRQENV